MSQYIHDINAKLIKAGRLQYRPICVYGSDQAPKGAFQVSSVLTSGHRCLAKALLKMAINEEVPPIFIGDNALQGCCFGAAATLGFTPFPREMNDLMSAESKSSDSMYLKATDDLCDRTLRNLGKITPPGKYVVMQACSEADDRVHDIRSVLCFGKAEQIRNLCGLIHFSIAEPFGAIVAPWGPHCAIFVGYPAGMAENAPKDTAFLGPTAPDGNDWFPEDLLALSMPIGMARRLSSDYDCSFAAKVPAIAYPVKREKL